jgi:hypothetical protein
MHGGDKDMRIGQMERVLEVLNVMADYDKSTALFIH